MCHADITHEKRRVIHNFPRKLFMCRQKGAGTRHSIMANNVEQRLSLPSGAMMSYTACSSLLTSSVFDLLALSASCVWKSTLCAGTQR